MPITYQNDLGELIETRILAEFTYLKSPEVVVQMLVVLNRVGKPTIIERDQVESFLPHY